MPTLDQPKLHQIYESVTAFSEDAMRYAIEQARDPEKGSQLAARLQEEWASHQADDVEPVALCALCVVLGEAISTRTNSFPKCPVF